MKSGNGLLAMGVAAVAVLAVVGGGAVASRRSPTTSGTSAAPLAAGSTPKPSATPSSTPTPTPTPAPATPSKKPVLVPTVQVDLAKLTPGRAPQVAYVSGRVIKGGLGEDLTVPGKQQILRAVKYAGDALVILEVGMGGSELASVGYQGLGPERIADVASLVTSVNEDVVAFATARSNSDHTRKKGNQVYWRKDGVDRKLQRPDDWASTVLAVADDTVYFSSATDRDDQTATLNAWDSGTGKVERLKSFRYPAGVDFQGTNGVDELEGSAQTFCSAIRQLENGKQLWRTCEYSLNGFTPDGRTVFGTPDFRSGGSDAFTVAIDSGTGSVKRQWTGPQFMGATAEDDDHLLMVVDSGENTPSAIIRCSIASGACELATKPVLPKKRDDLRLLGGWR